MADYSRFQSDNWPVVVQGSPNLGGHDEVTRNFMTDLVYRTKSTQSGSRTEGNNKHDGCKDEEG